MEWNRLVRSLPGWSLLVVLVAGSILGGAYVAWHLVLASVGDAPVPEERDRVRSASLDGTSEDESSADEEDGETESSPQNEASTPGEETPEVPFPSIPVEAPGGERSPSPRQPSPRQPPGRPLEPSWPLWNHPACPCDGPPNEGTGILRVSSPSIWVEILVDGESCGGSPTSVHLPADEYAIELRPRGKRRKRWRHRVRLCGDSVCNLSVNFDP